MFRPPSEHALHEADHVRIKERAPLPEGHGEDRVRHVLADAGEVEQGPLGAWNLSTVSIAQLARKRGQARIAMGEAERPEDGDDGVGVRRGERGRVRILGQEALIDGENKVGARPL